MNLLIAILVLLVAVASALALYAAITAEVHKARRLQLEAWITCELHHVERDCRDFPQAVQTVRALRDVLPKRSTIAITPLRRALAQIERLHDAAIVEQTMHWSHMQSRIAAEAAKGAPLPGFEGGAS